VKLQFSSRIEIRTTPKLFRSDTEAVKWTTLPVFDAIHEAFPKYVCLIKPLRARNIPPCGIEMIKPYTTNLEGRMSILAYLPSLILAEIEMILGWIRHDQSILNYDIYIKNYASTRKIIKVLCISLYKHFKIGSLWFQGSIVKKQNPLFVVLHEFVSFLHIKIRFLYVV